MGSRLNLDNKLREILGSTNVYYQPPESVKISYPCIIYDLADIPTEKADNGLYIINHRYTVTLIHHDADTDLVEKMLESFTYIDFDRNYSTNNLHHFVFELNYQGGITNE